MKQFANHCVRTGCTLDYWNYSDFLFGKSCKALDRLKTAKAKNSVIDQYQKIFSHLDDHVLYYSMLFQSYRAVQYVKNIWLEHIDKSDEYTECYIGETKVPHEGVVVHYQGSTVKMVSRETFSKANFARFQ